MEAAPGLAQAAWKTSRDRACMFLPEACPVACLSAVGTSFVLSFLSQGGGSAPPRQHKQPLAGMALWVSVTERRRRRGQRILKPRGSGTRAAGRRRASGDGVGRSPAGGLSRAG